MILTCSGDTGPDRVRLLRENEVSTKIWLMYSLEPLNPVIGNPHTVLVKIREVWKTRDIEFYRPCRFWAGLRPLKRIDQLSQASSNNWWERRKIHLLFTGNVSIQTSPSTNANQIVPRIMTLVSSSDWTRRTNKDTAETWMRPLIQK